ncbi:hypothetical protein DM01DRAFT_1384428 [Hesseltinella vesiculosa]|uniref:Uncharacterized protein n=1 Tax=Hesseltinella vesiculosa TaxID=101127 RepID=A0A1X2GE71_9FUNG|nr:hypothetical protein DM01DRAFT_1384428 [Hesseltinella vesiculosa]
MMVPSKRIRLDFDDDTPIMFSYAELAKRHESRAETHPAPLTMATEEDAFFKSLLERASQYDVGTAGEDVDSGDEDNAPKDGKANEGDEYDYEDPFIDDSDLLLDHPYDYAELEFDGYFAYRGVLEGTEVPEELLEPEPTPKRRSTASNRSKPSASSSNTNGVSKAKSTTSAQKAKPNDTTSSASASDAKGKKPAMKKSTSASTSTAASSSSVHDETNKEADDAIKAANAANDGHVVLTPIDASLLPLFDKLRELRKSETFEVKAKFPVSMRPCVIEIGVKMFRLYKQVDENILRHLMEILPYNRFTLKVIRFPFSLDPTEKLILFDKKYLITKAGPLNITEAQEEIERLIPVLAKNVEEAMPEQVNAYHQKLEEQSKSPILMGKKKRRLTLFPLLYL